MAGQSQTRDNVAVLTIEELVVRAQGNDMRALEELVKRNQKNVYVTLYQLAPERTDTMDLAQEVLLRMCRSIKALRNPKTFKFWLNRIITNLFYDELRKKSRQLPVDSLDDSPFDDDESRSAGRDVADARAVPSEIVLNTELDRQIQAAISNLPEQFRTIIVLREIQGLSYEEIAALTQTNIGTVKSRLARARLKLQEVLGPYLQEE